MISKITVVENQDLSKGQKLMMKLREALTKSRALPSDHLKTLALTLMVMGLGFVASPSFAQSLELTGFTAAITDGIQLFFNNLPTFMVIGFAVYGVIYAFKAGLAFVRGLLSDLASGMGGGK